MPAIARADAVQIPDGSVRLDADLYIPSPCSGLVIFAHGSGSSRFSSRNRQVAESLQDAGFATLLLDLLTRAEEAVDIYTREFRFDIGRLGRRVVAAADWAAGERSLRDLNIGYFGASTGAAAALMGAAGRPDRVHTVVSRGGRPDLAGDDLPLVRQPTLLIVGGRDEGVIDLNRRAMQRLAGEVRLELIPGAGHLFEEPGTLEHVAGLARDWFVHHLAEGGRHPGFGGVSGG